jgi:putative chitinase
MSYRQNALRTFLGQAAHESGGFKLVRENLNYSAEVMCRVWSSRFKTVEEAAPYARNPKALAEKVYCGRMGNDTPEKASLYIGRGFLQLTGYDNHKAFAHDMNAPQVLSDPSLLEGELAFETALWFFQSNNLFKIADEGVNDDTIKRITKRVNGGYHGLEDRTEQTNKIYGWLT